MISANATHAAFGAAVVIGGANFIAVRFSNAELDPLFGAAVRFTGAAAILLLLAVVKRASIPTARAVVGAAFYGLLGFGVGYALIYYALVGLTAGTASVIMASVPLLTLALAVAHGQERFTKRGLIGAVMALVGIAVLSLHSVGRDVRPVYFAAAFLGAAASAESSVVAKGLPRLDPIVTNGIGMTAGAAMLWTASLLRGESWTLPVAGQTWFALAYVTVFGSVVLFMLFLHVMQRWTASATVYALAAMPAVAVVLGSAIADEPITWELTLGGALVMAAVYVGALSKSDPKAPL